MQLNLYRTEVDVKHNRTKKISVRHTNQAANPALPWWKEFEISKKELSVLPDGKVCVFCRTSEDCVDKFGEFLHHVFSGKGFVFFLTVHGFNKHYEGRISRYSKRSHVIETVSAKMVAFIVC